MTKNILLIVEKDFQDMEVMYPYYRMIEAGHNVVVASNETKEYHGKYGYPIKATKLIGDCSSSDFDAIIIPGGWAPDFMRRNPDFANIIKDLHSENKIIAAICHGPWMLASAGIIKDKNVTSFFAIKDDLINAGATWKDQETCIDQNIITARKPDDLPAFCREIIKSLE